MALETVVVQAIYPFKGSNNDELCFNKGDVIIITQQDEEWWEGTLHGKTGWFPSNYVKEIKDGPKPTITSLQNQYQIVVLKDLIDSERAHVTELEGLVTIFLQPLEKSTILTNDEYKQLTGNLPEILETHQQLLASLENEETKNRLEQRVGKIFLNGATKVKNVHQTYCALHPRAVCILDKYKDELAKYMESRGASSPGVLVLTTLLSKPFRRLDKYSGMLQELERHVEESHPDRGDIQRSVSIYKEIASSSSAIRRQKELELQVLTGPVRGWEGPPLISLGEIIYMGSVAVGPQHNDRYLVLFPSTLLILSVSHRLSAFIYEGKLPLSGLNIVRLEDDDQYKNAFEISGPMIEKKIALCQSKSEANYWVDLLKKNTPKNTNSTTSSIISNSNNNNLNHKISPLQAQFVPQPPPHLNQRGYCNRSSILSYKSNIDFIPFYPSENYPSAAPFVNLTKFYRKSIKDKRITSKLLKILLYPEYINNVDISKVKFRRHKNECHLWTKATYRNSVIKSNSDTDTDDDDNDDDDDDDDSNSKNASDVTSNSYGYIRYYNPENTSNSDNNYESFIDYGEITNDDNIQINNNKLISIHTTKLKLNNLQKQISENSETSSCLTPKPYLACEDLVNLDETLTLGNLNRSKQNYMPTSRQSCPTKFVGNKFNVSSLTTIYIPPWSCSENNINYKNQFNYNESTRNSNTTHSSSIELTVNPLPLPDNIVAELLYNSNEEDNNIIRPPSMFQESPSNNLNLSLSNVEFRKHSINSDKPRRRSSIHINPSYNNDDKIQVKLTSSSSSIITTTTTTTTTSQSYCVCCQEYSPRSSDSGMVENCILNSPDSLANLKEPRSIIIDMNTCIDNTRNLISLSEIEARHYELQCPCTSPFGSTPRTSTSQSSNEFDYNKNNLILTSSLNLSNKKSTNEIIKSKSMSCLNIKNNINYKNDEKKDEKVIFKSGLYAHWWLKAKIPNNVIKGIYQDTHSPITDISIDSNKQKSHQQSSNK